MKKLTMLLLLSFITVFSSCSKKDDEPIPPMGSDISSALNAYQMAKKLLYENGHPAFTFSGEDDIYLASAATGSEGHKFIFKIISFLNSDWNGKDYDFKLYGHIPLEYYGEIKVFSSTGTLDEEGVYYKLVINLQNLTPYTLKIISEEKAAEYDEEGIDVISLPQS